MANRLLDDHQEVKQAYEMLAINGVSELRAKTIANGIDVLATRWRKEGMIRGHMMHDIDIMKEALEAISNYKEDSSTDQKTPIEIANEALGKVL